MKKAILFCLGLVFCTFSFVSCSDDDDDNSPYIVAPKADIEFKEASLKTVKEAVQGTWWIKNLGGEEYNKGDVGFMVIKGDRIKFYGGALTASLPPKWRDIIWTKVIAADGSEMHAFYSKPDQSSLTYVMYRVPYRIKDNVLFIGSSNDENENELSSYVLLTEDQITLWD